MTQPTPNTELRDFMIIVRAACILVIRYIERKYMNNKSATPVVEFGEKSSTHEG